MLLLSIFRLAFHPSYFCFPDQIFRNFVFNVFDNSTQVMFNFGYSSFYFSRIMPLNWEINNISTNSWRSVLLEGETGVSRGNRPHVRGVLNTTLGDQVCLLLVVGRLLSLGTPVSSTNKTHHHDIAEIVLKVELNTINNINTVFNLYLFSHWLQLFSFIPCHTRIRLCLLSRFLVVFVLLDL